MTQSFGQGGFTGGSLTCGGGGGQNNYGYGGGVGGGGQHTATPWIHDREVHNLIENVSKGIFKNLHIKVLKDNFIKGP